VLDAITKINSASCNQPRLAVSLHVLQEIEQHFKQSKTRPDVSSVSLYAAALHCVNQRCKVLAFLYSCLEESTEALYYSIPTALFSQMYGKPCKTRDLETWKNVFKNTRLFTRPALLTLKDNQACLIIDGKTLQRLSNIEACCLASIPTASILEQFVLVCSANGLCRILSTTRKNILDLGSFQLDVPEDEKVDWIDVRLYKSKTIVEWGGTDSLRGSSTWQYFCGLDIDALGDDTKDLFTEIKSGDVEDCEKSISGLIESGRCDFEVHGSELTLWTNLIDTECEGRRIWNPQSKIVMNKYLVSQSSANVVWGCPNQYVEIDDKCKVRVVECLQEVCNFRIDHCPQSFCVLWSHSNLMRN
jgi:hypothetical protein